MKRFWLGILLLIFLLALCLLIAVRAAGCCLPTADLADRAALACTEDAPEAAEALLLEAAGLWQDNRKQIALWADHTPMEQAEQQFSQALALLRSGESGEAAAACAGLAGLLRSIAEAQQLSWQNLL